MPEDVNPCLIMINKQPHIPIAHPSKNILTTMPICTIEEYAIITFISLNDMIRTLDNTPPIKAALRVKILVLALKMKSLERIKPKPPNLSNTPARIIEPITGASTWALGNHRWNPKQGSLTKNPKTRNREIPALLLKSESRMHE
jgi:hypothetical protein